jgi:hypothetical protein
MIEKLAAANTGSTGNNTHNSVQVWAEYDALALHFVVEAVGATPTVTYKFQGSLDGTNWFDINYITDATDTGAVSTKVRTTTGADVLFLSNPVARKYQFIRCVTSANTNVTYRAEIYRIKKS